MQNSQSAYTFFTYFYRDAEQCFTKTKEKVEDSRVRKILGNTGMIHSATNIEIKELQLV